MASHPTTHCVEWVCSCCGCAACCTVHGACRVAAHNPVPTAHDGFVSSRKKWTMRGCITRCGTGRTAGCSHSRGCAAAVTTEVGSNCWGLQEAGCCPAAPVWLQVCHRLPAAADCWKGPCCANSGGTLRQLGLLGGAENLQIIGGHGLHCCLHARAVLCCGVPCRAVLCRVVLAGVGLRVHERGRLQQGLR
jgi:hypothetical protein